jgi:perosamine synthetase
LQERGVGYAVFYPVPIHQQTVYLDLGYMDHLPEAERAAAEVVSLPIHPGLGLVDLEMIVSAVNTFADTLMPTS